MISGEWGGTMNLTEPHCGTDLGLLRGKAAPNSDGSYKISGQKIFISAGEHDLTNNIIHLVLARIEGAPEGVKGISLFIVPKFLINKDGSPGKRNGVSCGKIEEKMGIHANSTCVMNFDEATGWLLGEEHKGLRAMFVMMNVARLGVGLQGLADFGSRLSERRRLREGPPPGAFAVTGPRRRTSPPIRSSCIPTSGACCLNNERRSRRGARGCIAWRSTPISSTSRRGRRRTSEGGRLSRIHDAGSQGLSDRQGLLPTRPTRSRSSAATAISANGAWSSSCATRGSR